jgi:hypothetical protein
MHRQSETFDERIERDSHEKERLRADIAGLEELTFVYMKIVVVFFVGLMVMAEMVRRLGFRHDRREFVQ